MRQKDIETIVEAVHTKLFGPGTAAEMIKDLQLENQGLRQSLEGLIRGNDLPMGMKESGVHFSQRRDYTDKGLREVALKLAHNLHAQSAGYETSLPLHPDSVVSTAVKFEDYLNRGAIPSSSMAALRTPRLPRAEVLRTDDEEQASTSDGHPDADV